MMKRPILAAALAALMFVGAAPAALASGGLPDEIVVGEDYTLAAGETLNGNLVVYGGDAVLEVDSRVTGDVVIVGGSLEANGEVSGDTVIVGGDADLKETAVVGGDLVSIGGRINREPGAVVKGQDISTTGPRLSPGDLFFRLPASRWFDLGSLGLGMALRSFGWAVTLGVLALLVLLFWPDQTARVGQAVTTAPLAAGAMGLLTAIAGGAIFTVLILALCLGLLGWLGLAAAILFGWIALGTLVGVRLAPALKLSDLNPALAGALGTFALTLVVEFLRLIPCLGPVLAIVLASLGLGAVILTRFGTRPYIAAPPPAVPPAPDAPLPPAPPPAPDAPLPPAPPQTT